ncbi:hypothetical protein fh0823_08480 [Francisella halioticida]|nr:hypothetical protein fh0823_08480 [Francisella halioticida]
MLKKKLLNLKLLVKQQREKALEKQTAKKEPVQAKTQDKESKQKQINLNRKIGLTVPKQKL